MLDTCLCFVTQHHLTFNPDKSQLIKFYKCADAISPRFTFLGQSLCLRNSVTHLGHILTHNLSDSEDISSITKDIIVQLSGNLLIPSQNHLKLQSIIFSVLVRYGLYPVIPTQAYCTRLLRPLQYNSLFFITTVDAPGCGRAVNIITH